jgi:hypothetical protein
MKHPVEWIDNKIVALSMGMGEAVGINQRGAIIGTVFDSKGNPTAAIWEPYGSGYQLNPIGSLVPGAHLFGGQINDTGDATMYGTNAQGQSVAYFYNEPTNMAVQIGVAGQNRAIATLGVTDTNVIYALESLAPNAVKGHAATQSQLVMISNGTTTNLQTLVPSNVTLLPNDITTGAGGSGFAVSPRTGIIVTPAQERIDKVKGMITTVRTFTAYLIPPACAPAAYRRGT